MIECNRYHHIHKHQATTCFERDAWRPGTVSYSRRARFCLKGEQSRQDKGMAGTKLEALPVGDVRRDNKLGGSRGLAEWHPTSRCTPGELTLLFAVSVVAGLPPCWEPFGPGDGGTLKYCGSSSGQPRRSRPASKSFSPMSTASTYSLRLWCQRGSTNCRDMMDPASHRTLSNM